MVGKYFLRVLYDVLLGVSIGIMYGDSSNILYRQVQYELWFFGMYLYKNYELVRKLNRDFGKFCLYVLNQFDIVIVRNVKWLLSWLRYINVS